MCGTCLDFYGVKDKLAAGEVSNMYDILGRMQEAAKVITLWRTAALRAVERLRFCVSGAQAVGRELLNARPAKTPGGSF